MLLFINSGITNNRLYLIGNRIFNWTVSVVEVLYVWVQDPQGYCLKSNRYNWLQETPKEANQIEIWNTEKEKRRYVENFEILNQFWDSKKEAMGKGWGKMQEYTRN